MPIYTPSEDSYLLSETLKKEIPKFLSENPYLRILEIGVGNGIQLETLKRIGVKNKNLLGCDINPDSIKHCKELGFKVIQSDLFKNIKEKFDIIIFNPPYLPEDKNEPENSKIETTAGKKGNEIIIKFLKQAKKFLENKGKIYLITSSLSEKIDFKKISFKVEKINSKKLFFEEIFVWRLQEFK